MKEGYRLLISQNRGAQELQHGGAGNFRQIHQQQGLQRSEGLWQRLSNPRRDANRSDGLANIDQLWQRKEVDLEETGVRLMLEWLWTVAVDFGRRWRYHWSGGLQYGQLNSFSFFNDDFSFSFGIFFYLFFIFWGCWLWFA